MPSEEHYDTTVRRLNECGYLVLEEEGGYVVYHITDEDDISRAHNLSELHDLADLIAWNKQRQATNDGAM